MSFSVKKIIILGLKYKLDQNMTNYLLKMSKRAECKLLRVFCHFSSEKIIMKLKCKLTQNIETFFVHVYIHTQIDIGGNNRKEEDNVF